MSVSILLDKETKDNLDGANHFIYGFGDNYYGQYGNGHSGKIEHAPFAKTVPAFVSVETVKICCGEYHSLIIVKTRSGNEAFLCGRNHCGQLGTGDFIDRDIPTKLSLPKEITSGSCSSSFTAVIAGKRVFTFGQNLSYSLGIGTDLPDKVSTPQLLTHIYFAKEVVCGYDRTVVLDEYSNVYIFGGDVKEPRQIYMIPPIKSIGCGRDCYALVSTEGELFLCGNFNRDFFAIPTRVEIPFKASKVSCWGKSLGVISVDEEVYLDDVKLKIKHAIDIQMGSDAIGILIRKGKYKYLITLGDGSASGLPPNYDCDKIFPVGRVGHFGLGAHHTMISVKAPMI